jgi:hypothetical protein
VAAAFLGALAVPAEEPPAPEQRFAFPEVQAAWEVGGEDGVKDWMRALVKRSKKAGRKIPSTGKKPKCGSCHESLKTYEQSPNAEEDLRGLLAPAS